MRRGGGGECPCPKWSAAATPHGQGLCTLGQPPAGCGWGQDGYWASVLSPRSAPLSVDTGGTEGPVGLEAAGTTSKLAWRWGFASERES